MFDMTMEMFVFICVDMAALFISWFSSAACAISRHLQATSAPMGVLLGNNDRQSDQPTISPSYRPKD